MKSHLRPIHIKAVVEKRQVHQVLVNGGVVINLFLECMLLKLGKSMDDLVETNVAVTNFNGKALATKGIVMLNLKVSLLIGQPF